MLSADRPTLIDDFAATGQQTLALRPAIAAPWTPIVPLIDWERGEMAQFSPPGPMPAHAQALRRDSKRVREH